MQTRTLATALLLLPMVALLPFAAEAQGAASPIAAAPMRVLLSVAHLAMDSAAFGPRKVAQDDQPSDVLLRFQLIEASTTESHDPAIADVDVVLRDLFRFGGYKLVAQAAMTVSGAGRGNYANQILSTPQGSYSLAVTASDLTGSGTQGSVRLGVTLDGLGDPPGITVMAPPGGVAPMLIVDGVVMASSTLRDFQASEIDRVEVLKGDAATQRFGPKAAAGVIVITTKSGAARGAVSGSASAPAPKPAPAPGPGRRNLLSTSVSVSLGRTIVLGSTQPGEPGTALILVVRPELR